MRIAAVQMVSSTSFEHNLQRAEALVREAAAAGAKLVALPENFAFMGRADTDKFEIAEAPGAGPAQRLMAGLAAELSVWLIAGSLPLRTGDSTRLTNSCLVYGPNGAPVARYDKIHLFRYDEPGEGAPRRYDEGAVLVAGDAPQSFLADDGERQWRVGLSICYDLRFPELYRTLMHPPCELIAVPSAFTYTTGRAHWELLLRARAVENQCYVIAPAQGGLHDNGRRTWGHTMIVDPWGEVLAQQPEQEGVVTAVLDPARLDEVRRRLPCLEHRRLR